MYLLTSELLLKVNSRGKIWTWSTKKIDNITQASPYFLLQIYLPNSLLHDPGLNLCHRIISFIDVAAATLHSMVAYLICANTTKICITLQKY